MKLNRRSFSIGLCLAAVSSLAMAGTTMAADWPQRPVTIVVPQAAGNSPDVMARILADKLSHALGQQFVVENKPGASNMVGTQSVARADADGYTLLFATSASLVMNPFTFASLSYDPMVDLTPVGKVADSQQVIAVNSSVEANTLDDLLALDKAAPGTLALAVNSARNLTGLIAQAINHEMGANFVSVAYEQSSQGLQDTIAGRTQFTIQGLSVVEPFLKEGSLRLVAAVGNKRLAKYPDVPAMTETIEGVNLSPWFMLMAPAGTPPEVIEMLSAELVLLQDDADFAEKAAPLGFDVQVGDAATPAGAQAFLQDQYQSTGEVLKRLGIKPE